MSSSRFSVDWWTRRGFLKAGAATAALASGWRVRPAAAKPIPDRYDGTAFRLAAPEPNAKAGGVLRMGIPNRPPHFDLHQSGTFFNLGAMGCMFDNLIRRDPFDRDNIIPDLAHSWDISKDGMTYTFFIRKDVLFHDGAELTAEDVKATYDKHGRCVIAVSEGVHDEAGKPILSKLAGELEKDAHGNVQLSGTGALADLLCEEVKNKLGIKRVRGDTFGYLQRSFVGCISPVDRSEAREVGEPFGVS